MKIFFRILAVLFSVAVITGCEQLTLENGKYETSLSGREDFAAIYDSPFHKNYTLSRI